MADLERPSRNREESLERELIRRLACYIDASSLSNTDHWRMSKLKREASEYLKSAATSSEKKRTISRKQAEDLARWLVGYLGPLQRDELTEPAVGYVLGQVGVSVEEPTAGERGSE